MKNLLKKRLICEQIMVGFLFFNMLTLTFAQNKPFYLASELGAGHLIYAGLGYNVKLFKSFEYIKSVGTLVGFTYLSEDSVYFYEPSLFITGEIVNNKIKINSKNFLDIDWRLKIGKIFINSSKYEITGHAFTMGADFLFKSFKYFFIDISLPIVVGKDSTELAPCIGAGMEFGIF